MSTATKKETNGPIFDQVRSILAERLAITHPDFSPSIPRLNEKQFITVISKVILRAMRSHDYSYDPTEGKLSVRFTQPVDLFQELSTGEKAYDFLRNYLLTGELWEDVVFINFRTGVTDGSIVLTSKKISAQAIQTAKNKPL